MTGQYPITLAEFRAWLETFGARMPVGQRGSMGNNPITRYVKARGWRGRAGYTGVGYHLVFENYEEYRTPAWATEFLKIMDKGRGEYITAGTALRLLDKAAHATLPDEPDWERTQLETEAVL